MQQHLPDGDGDGGGGGGGGGGEGGGGGGVTSSSIGEETAAAGRGPLWIRFPTWDLREDEMAKVLFESYACEARMVEDRGPRSLPLARESPIAIAKAAAIYHSRSLARPSRRIRQNPGGVKDQSAGTPIPAKGPMWLRFPTRDIFDNEDAKHYFVAYMGEEKTVEETKAARDGKQEEEEPVHFSELVADKELHSVNEVEAHCRPPLVTHENKSSCGVCGRTFLPNALNLIRCLLCLERSHLGCVDIPTEIIGQRKGWGCAKCIAESHGADRSQWASYKGAWQDWELVFALFWMSKRSQNFKSARMAFGIDDFVIKVDTVRGSSDLSGFETAEGGTDDDEAKKTQADEVSVAGDNFDSGTRESEGATFQSRNADTGIITSDAVSGGCFVSGTRESEGPTFQSLNAATGMVTSNSLPEGISETENAKVGVNGCHHFSREERNSTAVPPLKRKKEERHSTSPTAPVRSPNEGDSYSLPSLDDSACLPLVGSCHQADSTSSPRFLFSKPSGLMRKSAPSAILSQKVKQQQPE